VIRVAIVCRPRFYREGLARFLADVDGISVEMTAPSRDVAFDLIAEREVQVLLLDLIDAEGFDGLRELRVLAPARVVVLGLPEIEQKVIDCAEEGIAGFVTRDSSLEDVVAAIEAAARDELICSPHLAGTLLRHIAKLAAERRRESLDWTLTIRELEVVGLIDRGLSNKQIARELHIELPTVKNHVHHILEKLHVHRRAEAAALVRTGSLQ
jgi:two-component system nitrate/nitrite response regulator NarL